MTTEELTELLKKYLRVEVVNPDYNRWGLPDNPTVKVRILWDGVTISEDEAPFIHNHGRDE